MCGFFVCVGSYFMFNEIKFYILCIWVISCWLLKYKMRVLLLELILEEVYKYRYKYRSNRNDLGFRFVIFVLKSDIFNDFI